jgi:hypothetical protein
MDKQWLEAQLEAGKSLAAIGAEAGKGASTVGYWITKHGLIAAGRARHSAKGDVPSGVLRDLVARGLSIREIGVEIGLSYSAVRHHLNKHGLQTAGGRRSASNRHCDVHGLDLRLYNGVRYRCPRCVSDMVSEGRRRRKAILVAEAGGKCVICGYDRCNAALEFHHMDPSQKAFAVSLNGVTRSLAVMRDEARKCVLLCSTCHKEVEAGVTRLPFRELPPI